jgi:hypothetical protein
MRNLMTVEEAKGVCKDRSEWKERETGVMLCMYHHHQPINVPTAGAEAFLVDYT